MRKIILPFIFILLTLIGEASEIDSLQNILKATQDDKAKCEVLARISYYYLFRNADTAIYYNKLARDLGEQIDFEKGKALAYNYYGIYLTVGGELPKAEIYYRKSIHLFLSIEDKVGLKDAYNSLAVCFSYGGQYDSSMFYNNKSIELKKELNDISGLFKAYNNNGVSYFYQGLHNLALKEYLKALDYAFQTKKPLNIATSYNNVGSIFQELNEIESAEEYLLKMEELLPKIEDKRLWGHYYFKKAYINTKRGQIDSAIANNQKAIPYLIAVNDLNTLSEVNVNLSTNYLNKNSLESAYTYIQKVIKNAIIQTDTMSMALGYFNLGEYYEKKENFDKSIINYKKSLTLSKDANYLMSQSVANKRLSDLYEKMGMFRKALQFNEKYITLKDSLQGIEKEKVILNLKEKYQVQLKDVKIKNLETTEKLKNIEIAQKEREKNWLVLSILFILFSILVILFLIKRANRRKTEVKDATIALQKKEIEEQEQRLKLNQQQAIIEKQKIREQEATIREQKQAIEIKELKEKYDTGMQEVASESINLYRELVEKYKDTLKIVRPFANNEGKRIINESLEYLKKPSLQIQQDLFEEIFIKEHPNFFETLCSKTSSKLSNKEKIFCAQIKNNKTYHEIATFFSVNVGAIHTTKTRAKEKFGFENINELVDFIMKIE